MKTFTPKKLISSRKKICDEHTRTDKENLLVPDDELKNLIRGLVELPENSVRRHAFALNNRELIMIASYLPYNYYKVDMKNLFGVIRLRLDTNLCDKLFLAWQMLYNNMECNTFLAELTLENEVWREFLVEKHLKNEKFFLVLKEQTLFAFMKEFYITAPSSMRYAERLQYYGVKEGTLLFSDVTTIRLLFYSKKEFEAESMDEILKIVRKYGVGYLRLFLVHFLDVYTLRELVNKRFMNLARILIEYTSEKGSQKWKDFFKTVEYSTESKYNYWINIYKIDEIFGLDERSNFWRNYRFESVKKYNYSNSIVMEFESHYVVEFLGKANGPMYVYRKTDDYFDKKVRYWFTVYNNQEIRGKLYAEQNFAMTRMAHLPNPGWWTKFSEFLRINKVAKVI